jgi:hypothetical protein
MIIPGWNEIGLAITRILQYPALSAAAMIRRAMREAVFNVDITPAAVSSCLRAATQAAIQEKRMITGGIYIGKEYYVRLL